MIRGLVRLLDIRIGSLNIGVWTLIVIVDSRGDQFYHRTFLTDVMMITVGNFVDER
jgi:hypothetical protein